MTSTYFKLTKQLKYLHNIYMNIIKRKNRKIRKNDRQTLKKFVVFLIGMSGTVSNNKSFIGFVIYFVVFEMLC